MIISVIIPAYNEEKDIGECIKSLKKQTLKNLEIIVIDDGSTDKTREVVNEFKEVKLILNNHSGPGTARNDGAKIAKGDFLIFVDSDMTFEKNYVKNLIKPMLNNEKIIGTTHDNEIVKNTENIWSKCWGKVRVDKKGAKDVKIFRAIRKEKFLELGGFDSKYGYADDQTFWFKYKLKPTVAENTLCFHKNPENLKEVYRQSKWIGASIDKFDLPFIKYFVPLLMYLISPITIILISVKKCYNNRNFNIFFWMIIFITVRYFGTTSGLIRKFYFKKNFR